MVLYAKCSHQVIPKIFRVNLSGSHTSAQLIDKLDIRSLPGNPWHVQATCATTGEGIYEGLNTLAKMVKEFKKTNTGRF